MGRGQGGHTRRIRGWRRWWTRPDLDPDAFFDTWASDLWSALVLQVIGQQISLAAAAAIRARLAALFDDRLQTAAELLATDDPTLRA